MKLLTTELAAQFEDSALLEKRIRESLEGIRFGLQEIKKIEKSTPFPVEVGVISSNTSYLPHFVLSSF